MITTYELYNFTTLQLYNLQLYNFTTLQLYNFTIYQLYNLQLTTLQLTTLQLYNLQLYNFTILQLYNFTTLQLYTFPIVNPLRFGWCAAWNCPVTLCAVGRLKMPRVSLWGGSLETVTWVSGRLKVWINPADAAGFIGDQKRYSVVTSYKKTFRSFPIWKSTNDHFSNSKSAEIVHFAQFSLISYLKIDQWSLFQ